MRIALVAPVSTGTLDGLASHRLGPTSVALSAAGAEPELVLYDDERATTARDALLAADGALVWVNPQEGDHDRTRLNGLLRDVAAAGVMVSAHPDVIDAIGTKEVVFHTRHLGWGSDCRLYRSLDDLQARLPDALRTGPRVLKRERGNGGTGTWRVEVVSGGELAVRHAARGSVPERMTLDEFVASCVESFAGGATMLDQAFQERITEGMIRAYLVGGRVAGFGEQAVNALYPAPAGSPPEQAPEPGPRLYHPPDRDDLQDLRHRLESEWVPALCAARSVDPDDLPVIWDADFFHGDPDERGQPGWVLCEINVSSVYPFPDSALEPLAAETVRRVGNSP
jgi:hypothetical protein